MALFRFDFILQPESAIPADNIVNTWHFNNDNPIVDDFDNVRDMLEDFYSTDPNVEGSGAGSITTYMPGGYLQSTALVRAYNLNDDPPRVPVYESTASLSNFGTASWLPQEVALVISFQGAPVAGEPQARRRNRKYLGPWTVGATDEGRPNDQLLAIVAGAGRRLREASAASVNWEWVWHSDTTGAIGLIDSGWVDNAWDTQRRRGVEATMRELFTIDTPPDPA